MLSTNRVKKRRVSVSLPQKKTKPPQALSAYKLFIYGHQKIGKTSLTAQFEDALHFFFEPSGTDYELFAVSPKSWEEFKDYITLLEEAQEADTLQYKNFVVDVVDLAYEMCLKSVCAESGHDYPPMNDFGKTWSRIKVEFRDAMIRLANLGGFIGVSHAKVVSIEGRKGVSYDRIVPTSPNGATEILARWTDLTGYYTTTDDGLSRQLFITPSPNFEAGNRMETRFKHEDGTPIEAIPMGSSAQEAYANLMRAFLNELPKPKADEETKEEPKKTTKKSVRIKKGAK